MIPARVQCDLTRRICVVGGGKSWKMPSDIVSIAVSTGLGVSVLAGILSGVCYVWAHGLERRSKRKQNQEWYCDVCGAYLRSIDGILEGDKVITCTKCQGRVCKYRCSSLSQQRGWICKTCLRPPESWFQGILSAIQPSSRVNLTTKMNSDSLNELDEDLEAIRKKEKEQVRDFIERLVSAMLGEDVDDASVTKPYNDSQYLPVTGQSPCTAHAALKQLIERLVQETINLPSLQKAEVQSVSPSDDSNRTYEDLLATAIINKVISSCQNNLPSSSAASVSSRLSNTSRQRDEKEYFFGEETLDNKWKTTDLDTSSISSLDEWIHSDSSFGSRKYIDRVTLTIKQDIEEMSHSDSENENENDDGEDDNEYFQRKSSLLNDDEQNWFLQKRQFQGTHSPVPVPMLVPNPTTDAKVLIGDREIDDTSDLSDIASDYGEVETVPGRQSLLLESKKLIGGKHPLQNGSESESSADSGVKEVDRRDRSGYDGAIFISKTDITVDDDNVEDASILSVYSNTEKEAEYTEKYGSLPRTIMKTSTPPSRPSLQKPKIPESTNLGDNSNRETKNIEAIDSDDEQFHINEFVGSYSKKEKEKWKHAVEMKHNPYSKENIEKRIKRSNSAVSSRFGPDYYARQASSPSGELKANEAKEMIWPPPQEEEIHKAVPAIVSQEDEDVFFTNEDGLELITPEINPQTNLIVTVDEPIVSEPPPSEPITSDSDLSYVNFYDVENSQILKKTKNGEEVTLIEAKVLHEESAKEANSNLEKQSDEEHIEAVVKDIPKVRERKIISQGKVEDRPNYVKAKPFVRQRTIPPPNVRVRRFKSETDLLDDSFDKPPTVIARKKDNTLISKIYLDPNVRNFALSSRDHLPMQETSEPKRLLRKQMSAEAISFRVLNGKSTYNSDDGTSLNHEQIKPYYSSEEDLIDSEDLSTKKENNVEPQSYQNVNSTNYRQKNLRQSFSSDEGLLSDQSSVNLDKPQKTRTRSAIYSSSEDLLSIDDFERTPKKKDNTLISKIYQDPNVRNFALMNRDYIPVPEEDIFRKKTYSSEEDLLSTSSGERLQQEEKPVAVTKTSESNGDITLDTPKVEDFLHPTPMETWKQLQESERKVTLPDPDIDELVKKKIVHNILGQFSKSQPNLEADRERKVSVERKLSIDSEEMTVSVKDLKKKFENNDGTNRVISSLTARSLSKQMRESLKN